MKQNCYSNVILGYDSGLSPNDWPDEWAVVISIGSCVCFILYPMRNSQSNLGLGEISDEE